MRHTILFTVDVLKRKVGGLQALAKEIEQIGSAFFQGCAVADRVVYLWLSLSDCR